jgi:hypothetical protein
VGGCGRFSSRDHAAEAGAGGREVVLELGDSLLKVRVLGSRLPFCRGQPQVLLGELVDAVDQAALTAFINLRFLNPEHEHWRRGIEAAVLYAREVGDLKVPFTYRVPSGEEAQAEGWPASLANFPLGLIVSVGSSNA